MIVVSLSAVLLAVPLPVRDYREKRKEGGETKSKPLLLNKIPQATMETSAGRNQKKGRGGDYLTASLFSHQPHSLTSAVADFKGEKKGKRNFASVRALSLLFVQRRSTASAQTDRGRFWRKKGRGERKTSSRKSEIREFFFYVSLNRAVTLRAERGYEEKGGERKEKNLGTGVERRAFALSKGSQFVSA